MVRSLGKGKAKEAPAVISSAPRRSLRTAVKNSSDVEELSELDEIVLDTKKKTPIKFKMTTAATFTRLAKPRQSTRSTTTISSNVSEIDDYDTPATSAMATPAADFNNGDIKGKGKAKYQPTFDMQLPAPYVPTKRKRGSGVAAQLIADEILAKRLQEEEYDDEQPLAKQSRTDYDFESDDLSSPSESEADLYEEEFEAESSKQKGKRTKNLPASRKTKSTRLPNIKTPLRRGHNSSGIISDVDLPSGIATPNETASEFNGSVMNSEDNDDDEDVDLADTNGISSRTNAASWQRSRRGRGSKHLSRAERERMKLERNHPELPTLWEDLQMVPTIKPVAIEQPDYINRTLKQFQLEGVDWMMKQEKTVYRGGLLGDEMGMGKTIQTVTLIMSDYPQKNPTLVVVPPVALMQWSSEIKSYTDGKLNVLVHHNTDSRIKKMTVKDLRKYDVVMISYAGLESIYRKETVGWKRDDGLVKENSRIHAIKWHRVILDEAHSIKSRTTGVAKACFALKADYKWCLSGTPVQNRIGEFFSLLRFLEIQPFACYFCKECSCAELHWKQDEKKACVTCGHTGFQHVSIFNQELLNPLILSTSIKGRKEALGKLRILTDRIMLRRLKRNHTSSMELPPKDINIHNEFFSLKEHDFSNSIMTNTTRTFDTYVSRGVMLNNYANIFGLIMQMRQVANHPDLILKKNAEGGQNVLVCGLCTETAEEPIRSRCHHTFCRQCAKQYVESLAGQEPDCPTCHIQFSIDFDQPDVEQDEDMVKKNSIINRIKMENWTSSTKIEMLVNDLYLLRKKHQTIKSIVFSQFTSMLQLVEWRLKRAGFSTVMLDGSMSPAQRQKSIEYFMNNVDVEVFLVSLKAGGVALNLTEASQVFIVDPWWNPAAEWQSADRCHRIGQARSCHITRLVIEDSVESRIVLLQEKKARLIASTVNNDDVAMEKLTPEDMQFLFRGN